MTDTEILEWIQENCCGIHKNFAETYIIEWFDEFGITKKTRGSNLRDCVSRALDFQFAEE